MFSLYKKDNTVAITFSSLWDHASQAIDIVRQFLGTYNLADRERSDIVLVSRELIINALVHGNRLSLDKIVALEVERNENCHFNITVEDDGTGFNTSSVGALYSTREPGRTAHGYEIITSIAREVTFNDAGNRVMVCIHSQPDNRAVS